MNLFTYVVDLIRLISNLSVASLSESLMHLRGVASILSIDRDSNRIY